MKIGAKNVKIGEDSNSLHNVPRHWLVTACFLHHKLSECSPPELKHGGKKNATSPVPYVQYLGHHDRWRAWRSSFSLRSSSWHLRCVKQTASSLKTFGSTGWQGDTGSCHHKLWGPYFRCVADSHWRKNRRLKSNHKKFRVPFWIAQQKTRLD